MSGICGIVGKCDNQLLQRMSLMIQHRGPDREDIFTGGNIGLCARGLDIAEESSENLILHNEKKDVFVIMDGELDTCEGLRLELEEKGHQFYTHRDTEIIVHLYEEFQEEAIIKLNGSFAIAIWDKAEDKLILARDRFGIKPLYYFMNSNNFIFASEIKPILECNTLKKEVDFNALSDFFTFLYIPSPYTMFKGIKKIPPASLLIYAGNNFNIRQYWDLKICEAPSEPEEFYAQRIYELLKESISSKLTPDTSNGVFLSGGLDSSSIVALLKELTPGNIIKTFSIGYTKKDVTFNELNYARLVARHFNCQHHEYIIKPDDALRLLPDLVSYMEEPFGNSSALVTYLICNMAKQKASVVFSGLGADELFAGSRKYIAAKFMRLYRNTPFMLRKKLFLNLAKNLSESTKSRNLAGWIKGFAERGIIPSSKLSLSWFSFFNGETKAHLYSPKLRDLLMGERYADNLSREIQEPEKVDFLREIFYLDVKSWLPDNLLTLADKMSMINSLNLYLPFCNDKILDLSTSMPFNLKVRGLQNKYILLKSLGRLLPSPILNRKRQGFTVPIGRWFKDEFKEIVTLILNKSEIDRKGYFNSAYIERMLQNHFTGRRNLADQLWALMTFELWHKIFIETNLYKSNSLLLKDLYAQEIKSC